MTLFYLFAAFAIGVIFAAQPAINGEAARVLGSAIPAAALSVAITFLACLALMPSNGGFPKPASFLQLPWWVILGGLIGAFVVAGSAAIVPVTGAAMFFVCLIAGQLVGSMLVDVFGAFGMAERPINLIKLSGVALALGGVVLVRFG